MKRSCKIYNPLFNRGRSSFTGRLNRGFCPLPSIYFCLACIPALFFSCTQVEEPVRDEEEVVTTRIRLMSTQGKSSPQTESIGSCQLLVFNDDKFQRLDSRIFCNLQDSSDGLLCATSGAGDKTVVLLCNLPESFPEWEDILSLPSLRKVSTRLEDESLHKPVMTGMTKVKAGESAEIVARAVSSRIRLRQICCDFRGTPYAFRNLENLKVYLTNVNADSGLLPQHDTENPFRAGQRYINNGGFNPFDCRAFKDPGLVYRDSGLSIGMDPVQTDLDFLCYCNPNTEEAFGCPLTRLVIEGSILGKTWYWPVDLCRLADGGIKPGENYDISLTILRTGTEDPDTPVSITDAGLKMEIEQWKEKENCPVYF